MSFLSDQGPIDQSPTCEPRPRHLLSLPLRAISSSPPTLPALRAVIDSNDPFSPAVPPDYEGAAMIQRARVLRDIPKDAEGVATRGSDVEK